MIKNIKKIYHLLKIVQQKHSYILFTIFFGSLAQAIIPYINLVFYASILNLLITKNTILATRYVYMMLIGILASSILFKACHYYVDYVENICDEEIEQLIDNKAISMSYEYFERKKTLDDLNKTSGYINGSGGVGTLIDYIFTNLNHLYSVLLALGFMIYLSIQLFAYQASQAVMIFVLLIIIYTIVLKVIQYVSKKTEAKINEINEKNVDNNTRLGYVMNLGCEVSNLPEIHINHMQEYISNFFQYFGKMDLYNKWGILAGKSGAFYAVINLCASCLVYCIICIYVKKGVIQIGDITMFGGAITTLADSLASLLTGYYRMIFTSEYLNTFTRFIHEHNYDYEGSLPIEKRDDYEYEFEFKNVSFKYPDTNNYILKNLNLKFTIGRKYALVGRNGCGKSTLIKLLCRLYEPTEGKILLNGMDISLFDINEYQSLFSVVFQDYKLFAMDLDENIAGGKDIDENKLKQVIEQVGLKEVVESYPDLYSQRLYKENGDGIAPSQGQAQKMAIARALYKDGPFVIMDEPTAALDPMSESEIYENFNDLVSNKTAIYISHRMSSCKFCDEILVLNDGKIIEKGTHEQLLENKGLYFTLFNAQAKYYQ